MAVKYDKILGEVREADEPDLSGYLQISNNLSDLDSASDARDNLGLGTMALEDASDYIPISDYSDFVNVTGDEMTGTLAIIPSSDVTSLSIKIPGSPTSDILSITQNDDTPILTLSSAATPVFTLSAGNGDDYLLFYHTGVGGFGQIQSSTGFVLASDNGTAAVTGTVNPQLRVQNTTANFNSITLYNDDVDAFIGVSNNGGTTGNLTLQPAGKIFLSPGTGVLELAPKGNHAAYMFSESVSTQRPEFRVYGYADDLGSLTYGSIVIGSFGDMRIASAASQISLLSNVLAQGSGGIALGRFNADSIPIVFGVDGDASIYYDGTNLVVNPKIVGSGVMNVLGGIQVDSLRIDQTPTSETPTMTHTITVNLNGTDYKIPCVAA